MGNYWNLIMRWRKFGVVKKGLVLLGCMGLVWFGWWVSDVPIGYYQFRMLCEQEGGLKGFEKIDPSLGWEVSYLHEAKSVVSSYPSVPFSRYQTEDGEFMDVRYQEGNPWWDSSYLIEPADYEEKIGYRPINKAVRVQDAIRLRKNVTILKRLADDQVMFISTVFIFTWTNPKNTLLGMSGTAVCPSFADETVGVRRYLTGVH